MDYGPSTGLSGVAVVVAAAFWTLLWGPVGLLLSTPLTIAWLCWGGMSSICSSSRCCSATACAGAGGELSPTHVGGRSRRGRASSRSVPQAQAPVGLLRRSRDQGARAASARRHRGALDHAHRISIKEAVEWVIDDLSDHDDASPPTP